MTETLQNITFDKTLSRGAQNAIRVCLALKRNEKVTLITDNDTLEIAASLMKEINEVGSECHLFVLEDYSPRPIQKMPEAVLEDLKKSRVSIFAAAARPGELKARIQMTSIINKNKLRHAHMVNITKQIMLEGMRADFLKVDELSHRLVEKARKAKSIRTVSAGGTDMTAEFSSRLKWLKTSGLISEEKWGNLPGGEIFTSPVNVNGTFVVDGVVGDYLCSKYGDLKKTPLKIEISDSRIKHLECDNKELLEEFTAYTMTDDNSNRVGEFAVGTNTSLKHVIGNILQDEKLPGIHIAFGHPYAEHTGADWKSTTHIDCVGTRFDIWFDSEKIMSNGKFLI
jgi:aminopeptidase